MRVVLAVGFNGVQGGHAYVEIFKQGKWLALDPTAGDYVEDGRYVQLDNYIQWNLTILKTTQSLNDGTTIITNTSGMYNKR